jgi:integrase
MFETAVTWELIPRNPFKGVRAPKCGKPKWYYLTPEEYRKLLQVAPTLRWKAIYALAYTAGPRFGELFSLTWDDIDFEEGELGIENRSATLTMPPFEIKDYEARTIPLTKDTLHILADLRTHNEICGDKSPFVVLDERRYKLVVEKWQKYQRQGRPWENQDMVNNINRELRRHLRWAKIKPLGSLSIHTLRKCAGKNWAKVNKDPAVTQKLMGHKDIKTTMEFYDQVTAEARAEAAAAIGKLLQETDARLTPDGDFGGYSGGGQS